MPRSHVVARQARVRRALGAGEAVPARAAHGCRDEVAAAEAVAVALHDRERLVPEHERAAVGRDAEEPFRDLAVGSADADLEHAHQQRVVAGLHGGNVRDPRGVGDAGVGDERQHQAAVRPPSITSTVPVTNSAAAR